MGEEKEARIKEKRERKTNIEWRKNKSFPLKLVNEDEFPDKEESLAFWKNINQKEASDEWERDEDIQMALRERRRNVNEATWRELTEEEFNEAIKMTAPWKAPGNDNMHTFPIKHCEKIRKALFPHVKRMIERQVGERWDDEDDWLFEGRTTLIYKGGERKDTSNYRPITCLPVITTITTLIIHRRMVGHLFNGVMNKEQR